MCEDCAWQHTPGTRQGRCPQGMDLDFADFPAAFDAPMLPPPLSPRLLSLHHWIKAVPSPQDSQR